MRGLNDQLRSWAGRELKYWEQAALEKVSHQSELSTKDLDELVEYFLEDAGLVPIPASRPKLMLATGAAEETETASCRLNRLFNLSNVNALPPGQEVHFGPQLTLIYGNNGAGKSGYARALGSAGFARGKREVLPNATGVRPKERPQAEIEILLGNSPKVIRWIDGKRCPELDGFYSFDGGSTAAHLTGANTLSFTPGSLAVLTRLADVTDLVRERVRNLIGERETPNNFPVFFDGDSEIKYEITQLNANTNLERLRRLGELNDDERTTLAKLENEIAELKLLNVPRQIEKRSREIADLRNLVVAVQTANKELGDNSLIEIKELIDKVRMYRDEVGQSGIDQFNFKAFSTVGSAEWRNFVSAAKALADAEGGRGTPYPSDGDHCLPVARSYPQRRLKFLGDCGPFSGLLPRQGLDSQKKHARKRSSLYVRSI